MEVDILVFLWLKEYSGFLILDQDTRNNQWINNSKIWGYGDVHIMKSCYHNKQKNSTTSKPGGSKCKKIYGKFRKIMVGGKKQEPKKTEMEMVTRRNEIEKSMWYSGLEL